MPTPATSDEDHQRRLEEASAVCARGRQYWTRDNNAKLALQEFEHALQLLETLLGTYHSLTAKTYYWLGFIRKHDPTTYEEALQAFVQTARIRLVLLGPSQEATQEAISAIRWVLSHQQHKSNEDIKLFLNQLYESIRLETLGDARLRHREYSSAIEYYQQAMDTFPDPKHATIMGKRAFCHFKGGGELDVAMDWYRKALLVFTTQTVHGKSHPDVPSTLERMEQVLQAQESYTPDTIQSYLDQVLSSVQEQYAGQVALSQGKFQVALDHFKATLDMEQALLGSKHGIIQQTLQPLVAMAEALCATSLEQTIVSLQLSNQQLQEQLDETQKTFHQDVTPASIAPKDDNMTTNWEIKCKDAEAQVSILQEKLRLLEETQQQQQQQQDEKIQSQLKDLTSQLAKASEQIKEKSKVRVQLEQSLKVLQSQLEETNKQKNQVQNNLQKELKEKVQQIEQLQKQVVMHQAKLEEHKLESTSKKGSLPAPSENNTNLQTLAQQLQDARDANAEFHKRLLSAEAAAVSLNDVRRKIEEKLKDALAQHAALQKELQQRDDRIAHLQSELQRLEGANHSAAIINKTPVGSPSRSGSQSISPDAESDASTVGEPSETQRQVEVQLRELQTDTRLKAQNERAIKTIQALSKELITLEEKYRKLGSKHEKLRQLFTKLEQVNRTLKEQNIQILKSSTRRSELSDSLHRRIMSSDSHTTGDVSSSDSIGSFESTIPGAVDNKTPPSQDILKSILLSQSTYRSSLAEFIVRRPHVSNVSKPSLQEVRLFGDSTISSINYDGNIHEPTTIEIVAMIGYDHSRLYLIGTQVIHRLMDGTCTNVDYSATEPLGWISYENKGQTLYYSLDEIVEQAQIYREHYCQSIALNATRQHGSHPLPVEMKILQWLAQRSPVLERLSYRYGSHAWTYPLDRPAVALSSFLMALLAIVVARFWIR